VVVSTSVAAAVEGLGAPRDAVSVVWSGVDGGSADDTTTARARARAEVRAQAGVEPGDFVVAVVGRLVRVKNVELAVRAVARLHHDLPQARLLVVGDGPERARLEAVAAGLGLLPGTVRFVGHRRDVAQVLAATDVMAITSTTEGLPFVLLEAAASGTPVVSTRVGAIPELFGDGAVALLPSGVETRPGGPEALADVLLRLALDPTERRRLARRAAEIQRRGLSTESMLRSTLDVYDQHAQIRSTAGSP
jgi:glycosyltransferase involved in cell wall biosynthesis